MNNTCPIIGVDENNNKIVYDTIIMNQQQLRAIGKEENVSL